MKNKNILLVLLLALCNVALAQSALEKTFKEYITGEFNNFQQVWLQNTDTKMHRIDTKFPHKHIHSVVKPYGKNGLLLVKHFAEADTQKLLGTRLMKIQKGKKKTIVASIYSVDNQVFNENNILNQKPLETINWVWNGHDFQNNTEGNTWRLAKDTLFILNKSLFKNEGNEAYRMIKCRFFSGWIQFPFDEIKKDSMYFCAGLKIHDQGGRAQLRLPDGKLLDWTVELTQLVHSKKTAIMKLAIYNEPAEKLSWNSRSASYAWTSPDAKRIGLNLRKIISGWTLMTLN